MCHVLETFLVMRRLGKKRLQFGLTVAFCVKNRKDILVISWLIVAFDHVLYRVRPRGDDSQDARSDDEVSDEELDMSHMLMKIKSHM